MFRWMIMSCWNEITEKLHWMSETSNRDVK